MQEQNEVLEILQQLREELNAPRGMFGKRTDIPYCCDLCDKLTRLLPSALADAEYLKQKRKEILTNADVAAKNTIRAAEEKAAQLSSESEVVKSAQTTAKQLIDNAYVQCDNLIMRTKSHLDDMFKETEQFLLTTLAVIRKNREELRAVRLDGDGGRQ